jgi:hypothetical protein
LSLESALGWALLIAVLLAISGSIVLPLARLFRVPPRRPLCVAAVAMVAVALWYAIPVVVRAVYLIL